VICEHKLCRFGSVRRVVGDDEAAHRHTLAVVKKDSYQRDVIVTLSTQNELWFEYCTVFGSEWVTTSPVAASSGIIPNVVSSGYLLMYMAMDTLDLAQEGKGLQRNPCNLECRG
jgi:hypothetical protein